MNVKVIFVLVCVLVAAAQAQREPSAQGWLQNRIDDLYQKLNDTVRKSDSDLEHRVQVQFNSTHEKIDAILDTVEKTINMSVETNGKVDLSKCKRDAAAGLGYVKDQAQTVSHQCVSFNLDEVSEAMKRVRSVAKEIADLRKRTTEELAACSGVPATLLACKGKVVSQAFRAYVGLLSAYNKALGEAVKAASVFSSTVVSCEMNLVKDLTKSAGAIAAQALDCVAEALRNQRADHLTEA